MCFHEDTLKIHIIVCLTFIQIVMFCKYADPSDRRWVGAWWGGFLLCGFLLMIVAIPFFSFPKVNNLIENAFWPFVSRENLFRSLMENPPTLFLRPCRL